MLSGRGVFVVVVVAVVLNVCCIQLPVMCFSTNSFFSTSSTNDNAIATDDTREDSDTGDSVNSITPTAAQHKWQLQQPKQHIPVSRAVDATKPSPWSPLCIGDKRCDDHNEYRHGDASDHHQSNDLAILSETLRPLLPLDHDHDDDKEKALTAAVGSKTLSHRSISAEDVVSMSLNEAPDVHDKNDEDCDDCDDGNVTVEDDNVDDVDSTEKMQNDQAAVYQSNGGGASVGTGSGPHHYGNMRSHQRATSNHAQTAGQQSQHRQRVNSNDKSDFNVEFTPEILIKQGRLRGTVRSMHSQSGLRSVHQFLGIPYAAAPVGSGRFMPPGAPPPWHGAKVFTVLSPVCPQNLPQIGNSTTLAAATGQISAGRYDQLKRLLPFLRNENEDCLFLNLYAPQVDDSSDKGQARFPVMVFVHGESYEWNSGNPYDGSVLASYGQVVVVTLNYRLGILGEFIGMCMCFI